MLGSRRRHPHAISFARLARRNVRTARSVCSNLARLPAARTMHSARRHEALFYEPAALRKCETRNRRPSRRLRLRLHPSQRRRQLRRTCSTAAGGEPRSGACEGHRRDVAADPRPMHQTPKQDPFTFADFTWQTRQRAHEGLAAREQVLHRRVPRSTTRSTTASTIRTTTRSADRPRRGAAARTSSPSSGSAATSTTTRCDGRLMTQFGM